MKVQTKATMRTITEARFCDEGPSMGDHQMWPQKVRPLVWMMNVKTMMIKKEKTQAKSKC